MGIAYIFVTLSFLCYSFWGFFNGIVDKNIDPFSALFYSSIGYAISGLIALLFINFQLRFSITAFSTSLLLGFTTGLGGLFLLLAVHNFGHTSILVALTATYPLSTVILNYFIFSEILSIRQLLGCVFSVVGVILMLL
jgi:uncharacterized membrane protein